MGLIGARAYTNINTVTGVESANPHRLVQMLFEGAIEKINKAKYFISLRNIEQKGKHISWAVSIVGGLRDSLDFEKGGEIAVQLDSLYEYCLHSLTEANLQNDPEKLNSVLNVLQQIKEGWDAISDETETRQQ